MLIHVLTFSNSNKVSAVTAKELELLSAAAEKNGHSLSVIYSSDCQMKFENGPKLLIKNHEPKNIRVMISRANFLSNNPEFNGSIIRQFEAVGIPVVNSSLAVMRAKNKLRTMQVLGQKNVPTPKTYIVGNSKYVDDVILDMGSFPVILKTVTGSHGAGVSIIESKRGLKSIVEMMIKDDSAEPLMVQEYVKESKGRDIRVFIVGKKIVAAMERIACNRSEFRSNFHLGGKVKVAELSEKEKEVAFAAMNACGLEMAGVDVLRTKTGPKVLEVNSNPGLEGITLATGKDIAEEIIKYAVEKAKQHRKKTKVL